MLASRCEPYGGQPSTDNLIVNYVLIATERGSAACINMEKHGTVKLGVDARSYYESEAFKFRIYKNRQTAACLGIAQSVE